MPSFVPEMSASIASYIVLSTSGMSNRGSPEGHMGHICVVMRATHDMPDIEYVFFIHNVFYTWK
jgi:hypothetical protein